MTEIKARPDVEGSLVSHVVYRPADSASAYFILSVERLGDVLSCSVGEAEIRTR